MIKPNDDCIEFDNLVMLFVLAIKNGAYREAKLIYDYLVMEYKDAADFLDEYIAAMYDDFSHFEFDNIAQNLAVRINLLDLHERLMANLGQKASVKKIKL
ncbi:MULTISPECIES: hypothetical protein [unclassified Methylophilus]|uniref:hypothetical protein n=1 Tax=unclassified Methylophilus TaxID=2630143 RepID=UPI00037E68F6|nr:MULTISPECIES: hypothetical protein [unclassified Methylophilus]